MKKWTGISIMLLALFFVLKNIADLKTDKKLETELEKEPNYKYGILTDTFLVKSGIVKNGQTLGEILYANHIDHPEIYKITKKSKNIFDVRKFAQGKKYTVLCSKDSLEKAQYFIYEKDAINYVVYNLVKDIEIYLGKKEVLIKRRTAKSNIKIVLLVKSL